MQVEPALQELVARVRAAIDEKTPLRIRGGGSKDFYGQALQGEILDTRGYSGIVSHEPSELVVTVRAGTPLAELEAALAEHRQYLPFEPPHFAGNGTSTATVGGMVASGLSGPARASVGAVRDFMLGAQLLNGKGELLTFGGQVMKNVAGYDVSRMLAGSLGTLGVITEVSLKVLPCAVAEATLVFELDEAEALARLNTWAGQALPLNASCWHEGALMLRLRGAQAAVASACQKLGGQRLDDAQAQRLWQALREQTAPFFRLEEGEALLRLSVPDTAPVLDLGPTLIEWHGAQRWLKLPLRGDADRLGEVAGHATLFRVTREQDKARGVFTPLAAPLQRIHQELKKQFDPAGIFNRGRMYPDF
jgi:glycolate oxidase FAD binding subunit